MPGWEPLRDAVALEFTQSREEGKNPASVEALRPQWDAAGNDETKLTAVFDALLALPIEADFPFNEPSDLATIRSLRGGGSRRYEVDMSGEQFSDKMHGAWLARCVGCALGKPVEGFMGPHNGLQSWQRQKVYLSGISPDEWPLRDYFPAHSPSEEQTGRTWCAPSTREEIAFMETDDDIRYTVVGQIVLDTYGRDFSTFDVAKAWMAQLPYQLVCTAETQAYRNLVICGDFHRALWQHGEQAAIDWNWVVHHQNPYREWIGAQIRVDSYGYGAPGNPELAADFAWRDARVSHIKNGIYGAMFCAAMISAAFVLNDPRAIIEAGLAEIPTTSRLYCEMREVIGICDKHGCQFDAFEGVLEELYLLLDHYDAIHTNNNCGVLIVALLLGNRDFHQTITLSVMGGFDSDCNGATIGSIIGAMLGAKALPSHWTARLHDTLRSQIVGYDPIPISQCAQKSVEIARVIAGAAS